MTDIYQLHWYDITLFMLQFSSHYDSMHIYGIYAAEYIVANIYVKYVFRLNYYLNNSYLQWVSYVNSKNLHFYILHMN